MTEFQRGETQGLVRAASMISTVAERLSGDDLISSLKVFLYGLRTDILRMAYAENGERDEAKP